MSDYNTDLKGLLHSANEHNATVYTGKATLATIKDLVGDYGLFINLINGVLFEFSCKEEVQTPKRFKGNAFAKLVNLWTLQQDLLKGNKFRDFIVINYVVDKGVAHFDIHPGRTRMYFYNSYHEPVPILFIDYTNKIAEGGILNLELLTESKCDNFDSMEYRLRDNTTQIQIPIPHLLVQPNNNEPWHYGALKEDLIFKLKYHDDLLTGITVNDESFLNYKDWQWKINTSI